MATTYPTLYFGHIVELPACCLNCDQHLEDEYGDDYCTTAEGYEFIRSPRYHVCTDHEPMKGESHGKT